VSGRVGDVAEIFTDHDSRKRSDLDSVAVFWGRAILSSTRNMALFWVCLVAICCLRAYIGLAGTRIYSHDAFMMLDGAWRMLHGQRPHVDFNTMVGPAAYVPTVVGLWLSGNSAAGFAYGQAFAGFLLGAWGLFLGRGRLSDVPRVALSLCVTALALSPFQLGMSPFEISPATTYNRYGYALLGLLFLDCVRRGSRSDFLAGISTGIVLSGLAFLKATYFLVALFMLFTLFRVRVQTLRRWKGIALGTTITALPFLAYLRFRADLMLADLRLTAAAKHVRIFDIYVLNTIFLEAALALILGLGAAAWLQSQDLYAEGRLFSTAAKISVCSSLFLIFSNYQPSELPLAAFLAIFIIDALIKFDTKSLLARTFRAFLVASGTAFVTVILISLLVGLLWGVLLKRWAAPALPSFNAPALASFTPIGDETLYTAFVNDGIRLLEANRRSGEHVMSLDFTNPFAFGLWIPPASGGTTNLQFGGSFDDEHRLPAERLFGSSELVMLPRQFSDASLSTSIPRILRAIPRKPLQTSGRV
jgi:hypothetical protein